MKNNSQINNESNLNNLKFLFGEEDKLKKEIFTIDQEIKKYKKFNTYQYKQYLYYSKHLRNADKYLEQFGFKRQGKTYIHKSGMRIKFNTFVSNPSLISLFKNKDQKTDIYTNGCFYRSIPNYFFDYISISDVENEFLYYEKLTLNRKELFNKLKTLQNKISNLKNEIKSNINENIFQQFKNIKLDKQELSIDRLLDTLTHIKDSLWDYHICLSKYQTNLFDIVNVFDKKTFRLVSKKTGKTHSFNESIYLTFKAITDINIKYYFYKQFNDEIVFHEYNKISNKK